jgi:hypothetical protein
MMHDPEVAIRDIFKEMDRLSQEPQVGHIQANLVQAAGLFSIASALQDLAAAIRESKS